METYNDLTKKIKRLDLLIVFINFAFAIIFLAVIMIGILLIINYLEYYGTIQ